jgi:hypothetical protein
VELLASVEKGNFSIVDIFAGIVSPPEEYPLTVEDCPAKLDLAKPKFPTVVAFALLANGNLSIAALLNGGGDIAPPEVYP